MAIQRHHVSYSSWTGCTVTFCIDPDTGRAWWEHDYDRDLRDVALEVAGYHRNNGNDHWKKGLKGGFVHAAIIPAEVRHTWRTQGLDPDSKDRDVQKKINSLLNTDYKRLKTTDKRL